MKNVGRRIGCRRRSIRAQKAHGNEPCSRREKTGCSRGEIHSQPSSVGVNGTNGPQVAQFGQMPRLNFPCISSAHGAVSYTVPQYMHLR